MHENCHWNGKSCMCKIKQKHTTEHQYYSTTHKLKLLYHFKLSPVHLEDGASPTDLLGIVWGVDVILLPVHPEGKGLSLVVGACLKDGDDAYPVALGEDALRGETDGVRLHQLPRGIVHGIIRETSHGKHLMKRNHVVVKVFSESLFLVPKCSS